MWQFWVLFLAISALKLLFIPAYRSTDFEVHRNWLAITHSLPLNRWYYESTSEWTLDYPPFFAYFEYALSHIAKYFDPAMLSIKNLNHSSEMTILFQRLSVIFTDIVYAFGVLSCQKALKLKDTKRRLIFSILLLFNTGLMMVDHIHFQYNGILFGILLLSLGAMISEEYLKSALYFSILLHMKHIFIYLAPVYFLYLLRAYCYTSSFRKSIRRLIKLGAVVLGVTLSSFGPFYDHLPQVMSRLFPFKRGLSHAYWAPNFWALYNFVDKAVAIILQRKSNTVTTTSGLVQEFNHEVLPSISPMTTFILTGCMMLPCLVKLCLLASNRNVRKEAFIRAITLCGLTSFMFGWHVHEKAILMVIIPISILSSTSGMAAKETLFLSIVGVYSLFPLLHPANLLLVKLSLYLGYILLQLVAFRVLFNIRFNILERVYCLGFIPLFLYTEILHNQMPVLKERLPFLPLLLTSVYCALGVFYFWVTVTWKFVSVRVTPMGSVTTTKTTTITTSSTVKSKSSGKAKKEILETKSTRVDKVVRVDKVASQKATAIKTATKKKKDKKL